MKYPSEGRYITINCGYILFTKKSLDKKIKNIEDINFNNIYINKDDILNKDDHLLFDVYGSHLDSVFNHRYYYGGSYLYNLKGMQITACVIYKDRVKVLNNNYEGLIIDVKKYKNDIIKLTSYLNEFFIRLDIMNRKLCSDINNLDSGGYEIVNV